MRFQSLATARAHCATLENEDDDAFVECTVRGAGASKSGRELEATSVLALVPPQPSFVGVDDRAMVQLLELRSYDPAGWKACVRTLDCA